jgi:16S rRNA (guanine1207-N2)-methyltransferase
VVSDPVLVAHAGHAARAWQVGAQAVPLVTGVGLRGHPDLDPALPALAEALHRQRLAPPAPAFVDATGGPAAILALARARGAPGGEALVTSAAARRAVLGLGVAARAIRADHPWDLDPASVSEAWWRPATERGRSRLEAELDGWAHALAPSGRLVVVWHKGEGAERAERLAAARFAELAVVTRASGWRVVELRRPRPDAPAARPWLHWDGPDGPMHTLVGTFAAERVDAGTAALLAALAADDAAGGLAGARVLDLGCGSGVLTRRALAAGAEEVLALDDDLAAVRSTLASVPAAAARALWSDLTLDAPDATDLDVVITNPPFHVGRRVVGALSQGFVAAARGALRRGGRLWLVANAALPFDRLLADWEAAREVTPAGSRGYRVFTAVRR